MCPKKKVRVQYQALLAKVAAGCVVGAAEMAKVQAELRAMAQMLFAERMQAA